MKTLPKLRPERLHATQQRGVVLFFTLIALLAMSLAAVALIRSVDTSTLIAGNLAFKQSATASGDAGVEAAMAWMNATEAANSAIDVISDNSHPFNNTNAANGYYSNADPTLNLFADATWIAGNSALVPDDGSGYTKRYVIQRMCRTANTAIQSAGCLFSGDVVPTGEQDVKDVTGVCEGAGCGAEGQPPVVRITSRSTGPRNTVSYIQAFVY